jgi:hypothetical protein
VPEKTLVEYLRLLIVTAPPTAVIFSGCDEALPVDPLKLSEVLESETEPLAQHGAAQRLSARGRRMCFFTGGERLLNRGSGEEGRWRDGISYLEIALRHLTHHSCQDN